MERNPTDKGFPGIFLLAKLLFWDIFLTTACRTVFYKAIVILFVENLPDFPPDPEAQKHEVLAANSSL